MTPPSELPRQSDTARVALCMAIPQQDGSSWDIPVRGSFVDVKRQLNGSGLVTLEWDTPGLPGDGDPIAVNPAHVATVYMRPAGDTRWSTRHEVMF